MPVRVSTSRPEFMVMRGSEWNLTRLLPDDVLDTESFMSTLSMSLVRTLSNPVLASLK